MNRPFLLSPVGKDYLWGGIKLKTDYGKRLNQIPLAESWECSTHTDGLSVVESGEFAGRCLKDVLKDNPNFLGIHSNSRGELPIMIKFIDAKEKLSVQVHPDDEYARENEYFSYGKTEFWYVVDAENDAELIYGFYQDTDKKTIKKSLDTGEIEKYLQKIKVKKDDVFYIEAGTVHAIGAGILLVEIQENSNLTYRLYDYDRVDRNGQRRELHIDKALDVMNYRGSSYPRQPMRVLRYMRGCAVELLCRCQYFCIERMLINNIELNSEYQILVQTGEKSFEVLLCLEGEAILKEDSKNKLYIKKGDCIFVPAESVKSYLIGNAHILKVSC